MVYKLVEVDGRAVAKRSEDKASYGGRKVAFRTHKPTGTVVACQEERSQLQNRDRAMQLLRAHLYEAKLREQEEKAASARRAQVGTGDRSEKIRTYNFPQDRLTDHRIGLSTGNLRAILDGGLDSVVDALLADEQRRRLAGDDNA